MAKFAVFFKDNSKDVSSERYIAQQEAWQIPTLEKFAFELQARSKIDHPDARPIDGNRWSLWVRGDGRTATNHICHLAPAEDGELSDFAKSLLNPSSLNPDSSRQRAARPTVRTLVIESGLGAKDSVGGEHPGYWTVDHFVSMKDELQRKIFLTVVTDIQSGKPSADYTNQGPDSVDIHIDRPDMGYGVHIHCRARWITL